VAEKKKSSKKPPATKKAADKAGAGETAKIPARYLKPTKETLLSDVFSVGPRPAGAGLGAVGLTAAGPPVLARLMFALGYSTVEEALGVLQAAKSTFVRHLGVPAAAIEEFAQTLANNATPIPAQVLSAINAERFGFGLILEGSHRPLSPPDNVNLLPPLRAAAPAGGPTAGPIGLAGGPPSLGGTGGPIGFAGQALGFADEVIGVGLPANINLISEMPNPVRNQNPRNTCVPHSCLAAYEHRLTLGPNPRNVDLSEQFFWWACKQRQDGFPGDPRGTSMTAAAFVLEQVGVCPDGDWPYVAAENPMNVSQGPPPQAATANAGAFCVTQVLRTSATSVTDFKQLLASGRCAAFAVPVFASSFNQNAPGQLGQWAAAAIATGRITLPVVLPNGKEPELGGHAMCMVGYQDDATVPALGGGRFIIRNSYGTIWGATSTYGPGYGTIPYAYIASMGREFGVAFV
jgi:hypothetical protein